MKQESKQKIIVSLLKLILRIMKLFFSITRIKIVLKF